MIRRLAPCLLAPLLLAVPASSADTPPAEQVLIVLDASGSMWGQIGGKPKLEIARETLSTVLADLPADTALGLMAYGHRSKGDCDDIELVVPVRAGSAADINAAAAKMRFLGMTPLSEAVARAARELRYTERRATVVLVTDGVETCRADPCALGNELEAAGVDFTAHVVGFGLSAEEGRQVACLDENTGGRYLSANDADGLAAALASTVVQAEPPPPPPPSALQAADTAPVASRIVVTWDGPGAAFDEVQVFDPAGRGGLGEVVDRRRIATDKGFAARTVEVVAPARTGDFQLRYFESEHKRVIATRPISIVPAVLGLEAPDDVAAGSEVVVAWSGPGAPFDEVQVFDPKGDGGRGRVLDNRRVATDKQFAERRVTVIVPTAPGEYVLRYWNSDNREVMATRPITVVKVETTLDAPASGAAGSRIAVRWTGPGARYDEVQVVDPAGNGGRGRTLTSARPALDKGFAQRVVELRLPDAPGTYELRYWNGDSREVLATRPITVE